MKKNFPILFVRFFLVAVLLTSLTPQIAFAESAECAFDNQEEYDKAAWMLNQNRMVKTNFKFQKDGLNTPINSVYISTQYDGKMKNSKIKNNSLKKTIAYKKSLIDFTLNVAAEKSLETLGLDTWNFHWKRPGKHYKSISADFFIGAFTTVKVNPPAANGDVNYDITYDPAYDLDQFTLSFGNLLSVSADPDKMMAAGDIAHAELIKPGYARAVIHWKEFFTRWNDNFSTPYKAGDAFPLALHAQFNPLANLLKEVLSKKYSCQVDYTDGNPFLDVSSTEDETWVTIAKSYEVPVSTEMLP